MASSVPAVNGFGDSAFSYDPAAAPPPTRSQQQQQPATQSPFHTALPPTQKDGTANALGFGAPDSTAIPPMSGSGAVASAAPGSERANDSIYIDFDILGDGKTDPNELMKTLKEQLSNPEAPIHNGMFGVFADKAQLEDAPPAASTKTAAPAGSVTGNENTGANDQLALERRLAELELNDAKAQLEDLKKQLSDSVSAHQSSLTQLADARNKLDDSMGQVAKLEGELNRVKSQNKTLTTDLSNAKDMWMKESSRASKLQDELNTRDDQIAEDSRRMAEMSATNEALQRENAQLKKLFEGSEEEVAARARAAENSFGQQNESYFGGARTVPSTSRIPAAMASSLGDMVAAPQTDGYIRPPNTSTTTAFTPTPTARLGTSGSSMKTTTFQPPATGTVSGGALLPHNVGSPATVERFRALIGAQEGVLYEDDILQIGVQSSYTCGMGEGQVSLYFGNKSSGALDGFAVELISGDDITLTAEEAVPTAIRAKQQIRLSMKVVCTKPTQQIPMMSMRFLLFDNTPRTLSLRLPILLSKFMAPVDIPNAGDFFSLWRHHTYHLSEQSAVVSITTSFGCRDSLLALARSATLGGVLKLHSQLDANPNNLVLCGKFPADSPEGIQCFTLPNATVLVRIEIGTGPQHSGKARVAVRSSEPVVALAVRDDLLLAFAELPADAEPSDPNFDSGAADGR